MAMEGGVLSDEIYHTIMENIPKSKYDDVNDALNKIKKENEKLDQELLMMYSIIMNDGVKTEIPFVYSDNIDKLQTNITLMLEKFKMMGSRITELEEDNEKLKEKNEANRIDVNILSKLKEKVRIELGCEPDPTQETIIKAIKELKEENEYLQENITEIMNDKKLLMVSDGLGGVVNVRNVMEQMDICKIVKEENDELKKENEKLKAEKQELKKYAKYRNELLYSDEPDTLKELNDDIDKKF